MVAAVMVNIFSTSHGIFTWPFLHMLLTMHPGSKSCLWHWWACALGWSFQVNCFSPYRQGYAVATGNPKLSVTSTHPFKHCLIQIWGLASSAVMLLRAQSSSPYLPCLPGSLWCRGGGAGRGGRGGSSNGELSSRTKPEVTCVPSAHIFLASICMTIANTNMVESKYFYVDRDRKKACYWGIMIMPHFSQE